MAFFVASTLALSLRFLSWLMGEGRLIAHDSSCGHPGVYGMSGSMISRPPFVPLFGVVSHLCPLSLHISRYLANALLRRDTR
jgi:hypothetical protein